MTILADLLEVPFQEAPSSTQARRKRLIPKIIARCWSSLIKVLKKQSISQKCCSIMCVYIIPSSTVAMVQACCKARKCQLTISSIWLSHVAVANLQPILQCCQCCNCVRAYAPNYRVYMCNTMCLSDSLGTRIPMLARTHQCSGKSSDDCALGVWVFVVVAVDDDDDDDKKNTFTVISVRSFTMILTPAISLACWEVRGLGS